MLPAAQPPSQSFSFHILTHSFARTKITTLFFSWDCALFDKNTRGWGTLRGPDLKLQLRTSTEALDYNKLSGSISTRIAVCGISFASQYAIAPLSSFVSTDRFGDLSKNWNRCSFFSRASGAVAGPSMRPSFPSCGERYSESGRDHRIVFSRLVSRTITFAREVNGGYAIICRKCNSRSKNAL